MGDIKDVGRDLPGEGLACQTKELGCYPMDAKELIRCFSLESVMAGVWLGSSL